MYNMYFYRPDKGSIHFRNNAKFLAFTSLNGIRRYLCLVIFVLSDL